VPPGWWSALGTRDLRGGFATGAPTRVAQLEASVSGSGKPPTVADILADQESIRGSTTNASSKRSLAPSSPNSKRRWHRDELEAVETAQRESTKRLVPFGPSAFNSDSNNRPGVRWAGARRQEIAQLLLDDFDTHQGVPFMTITDLRDDGHEERQDRRRAADDRRAPGPRASNRPPSRLSGSHPMVEQQAGSLRLHQRDTARPFSGEAASPFRRCGEVVIFVLQLCQSLRTSMPS
jgi:hypothetical protein